jgi:hypothetical protein
MLNATVVWVDWGGMFARKGGREGQVVGNSMGGVELGVTQTVSS